MTSCSLTSCSVRSQALSVTMRTPGMQRSLPRSARGEAGRSAMTRSSEPRWRAARARPRSTRRRPWTGAPWPRRARRRRRAGGAAVVTAAQQTTTAPKVSRRPRPTPTTRASSAGALVDPERLETTRTTTAIGTVAIDDAAQGAQVSRSARRPNHWRKTAEREDGGHGVGDRQRQGQAADAERVHQHEGQRRR